MARLARGWLVETWTLRKNLLHHTIVDGDGRVLDVEKRTAEDTYNICAEDPLKGSQTIVSGPGNGNVQSPAGWLGAGAQQTFQISGNNVDAYLDTAVNNQPDKGGTPVTSGDFVTAVDFAVTPTTNGNKAVSVQNLFYLNNVIHDILYRHGFDEVAGNFQVNNFGKGGRASDAVNAEAQDGSGTDNANFATPPDGQSPRMQMYPLHGRGRHPRGPREFADFCELQRRSCGLRSADLRRAGSGATPSLPCPPMGAHRSRPPSRARSRSSIGELANLA